MKLTVLLFHSSIIGIELKELIYVIPILKIELKELLLLFQQSLELMFVFPQRTATFKPFS